MTAPGPVTKIAASIAVALAVISFVLGSAPFTPALALGAVVLPMALITLVRGMSRTSLVAIYWTLASLFSAPFSKWFLLRIDYVLAVFTIVGVSASFFLLYRYLRSKSAA